ncbi:MAG TPA: adenylate/guanylate cyclase domain-containing protein, partial [Oceanipulchritudo sp.]|nr:adenylate/guanylate cyclase domain-containing protein [Oceanipulchritudo sp.]
MSGGETRRKLAAILSADVKGYSRLMGDDEAATVRTITTYRQIFSDSVSHHHGRVVDSPGDNILAEFASVVDAVQAAMEVQKELGRRNAELPDRRRMDFRIGINLGDVIEEEGRLYGDGVNVAARIEELADPGGICISGTAFDQVRNKLKVGYSHLGEHRVKNICDPVRVYGVLTDPAVAGCLIEATRQPRRALWWAWASCAVLMAVAAGGYFMLRESTRATGTASAPPAASAMFEGPSIAVLPFANMTGDPAKEFLCDGIAEDIINALSRIPNLAVIARQSTFVHKGKASNVQELANDLGARYVLEGSVRRADDRLRVSSRLIDAQTGKSVWAETYDREVTDLFKVQEEITLNISAAMQVKLTEGLQAGMWRKEASNLEAYVKLMQAAEHFRRFNKEDNRLARERGEEALEIDPGYVAALRLLGWVHWSDARFGFSSSPGDSMKKAMDLAQQVRVMEPEEPSTYYLLAGIHLMRKEHDQAVAQIQRASEMAPNSADIQAYRALCLNYAGEPAEALLAIQKAMRLNPHYPNWYDGQVGLSFHLLGDHQRSVDNYTKMKERLPGSFLPRAMLVIG